MARFKFGVLVAAAVCGLAFPALAEGIPQFGKSCVGSSGWNKNVCVSSNGKTLSSTYDWKGSLPTKGKHTNCRMSGASIVCSGGAFSTSKGNGKMDPVTVKLKDGKPVSVRWN